MRENSYTAVIVEMTVRALWEVQNTMDCIPDESWDRQYGGIPIWRYLYHALHRLDQWFVNPGDPGFIEPPIHRPGLDDLRAPAAARLTRRETEAYFSTIKARLALYLTSLHDEDLLQRPENCSWTRFTLILAHYRQLHLHLGMLMGFVVAGTRLCPKTMGLGRGFPKGRYDPYE